MDAQPAGGGGSGDAESISPALQAVIDRLDDLRRRRLLSEPPGARHALEVLLHGAVVAGWQVDVLADAITDASFERVGRMTAVLAKRTRELTTGAPPAPRPARHSDLVPPPVLAQLEEEAAAHAWIHTDGAPSAIDPELQRRRLDELVDGWLAQQETAHA